LPIVFILEESGLLDEIDAAGVVAALVTGVSYSFEVSLLTVAGESADEVEAFDFLAAGFLNSISSVGITTPTNLLAG